MTYPESHLPYDSSDILVALKALEVTGTSRRLQRAAEDAFGRACGASCCPAVRSHLDLCLPGQPGSTSPCTGTKLVCYE
jgi:hypothetical protein